MSANAWVGLTVGVISICGSFALTVRWLVFSYLAQLVPDNNGGHNIEGRLRRLEESQARIETRVDQIYLAL
jgi:hypothetical protein